MTDETQWHWLRADKLRMGWGADMKTLEEMSVKELAVLHNRLSAEPGNTTRDDVLLALMNRYKDSMRKIIMRDSWTEDERFALVCCDCLLAIKIQQHIADAQARKETP